MQDEITQVGQSTDLSNIKVVPRTEGYDTFTDVAYIPTPVTIIYKPIYLTNYKHTNISTHVQWLLRVVNDTQVLGCAVCVQFRAFKSLYVQFLFSTACS